MNYIIKSSIRKLASRLAQINVLIVDDDLQMSKLVKDVLEALGFEKIYMAKDGSSGLKVLRQRPIDLVITDWQMEPLNGIDFVRYVRTSPDSPNRYIPIVMMTGRAEKEDVELARDIGVTEYVVKPFTARTLMERIVLLIENPRSFIVSKNFKGPDRRRRAEPPMSGVERRSEKRATHLTPPGGSGNGETS